jgi:hypothetical protein
MKKQLTPQQRAYQDAKDGKIMNMIGSVAVMALGLWMALSPAKPEHAAIERVSTALVKDIWGLEGGIVLLALGGLWMFFAFRGYRKFIKITPKPQ